MLVNEIGEGQQGARSRSTLSELETLSLAISQLHERSDVQSKQISSEMGSRCQKSKSLLLSAWLIRERTSVSHLSWMIIRRVDFQRRTLESGCWFRRFSRGHALRFECKLVPALYCCYHTARRAFLSQGCGNWESEHAQITKSRHFRGETVV